MGDNCDWARGSSLLRWPNKPTCKPASPFQNTCGTEQAEANYSRSLFGWQASRLPSNSISSNSMLFALPISAGPICA